MEQTTVELIQGLIKAINIESEEKHSHYELRHCNAVTVHYLTLALDSQNRANEVKAEIKK